MGLTDKQIEFMKYMESTVLPNRRNVDYNVLIKAGSYVGISINTSCRTCAHKSGTDLLNMYGSLKPAWLEWQTAQKKEETITTQYESEQKDLDDFNKIQEAKISEAKATDIKLEEWTSPTNKRKKNPTK